MLLTLGEFTILDDGHLNSHTRLKLAHFVFLSLHYVPFIISLFILISDSRNTVFQPYGHQIILQTQIVLLYFRKKVVCFISKKTFDAHHIK